VVAVPVTGLAAGWSAGIGVLVGAVIVTAFFSVSSVVVAWAGKMADSFTLPAALLMFFVKALVLFVILDRLPADGRLDRRALACAVVAGALLWSGVQLRWVWTRKLYYVPPPAPPSSTSEVTSATARPGGPPAHPGSPENSG
jgi:prepilin signal peptidase PulO-like enzyme (type II secretory pathway)